MVDTEIQARIINIERMLSVLIGNRQKPAWVKISDIREFTGWDNNMIRRMREMKLIEYVKRTDGSEWYNLNSINPLLIKIKNKA